MSAGKAAIWHSQVLNNASCLPTHSRGPCLICRSLLRGSFSCCHCPAGGQSTRQAFGLSALQLPVLKAPELRSASCPVLCRAQLTLALQMLEAWRPQVHASSAEQTQSSSQSCYLSCHLRVTPPWVGQRSVLSGGPDNSELWHNMTRISL